MATDYFCKHVEDLTVSVHSEPAVDRTMTAHTRPAYITVPIPFSNLLVNLMQLETGERTRGKDLVFMVPLQVGPSRFEFRHECSRLNIERMFTCECSPRFDLPEYMHTQPHAGPLLPVIAPLLVPGSYLSFLDLVPARVGPPALATEEEA